MADNVNTPPTDGVEEIERIIVNACGLFSTSPDAKSAAEVVQEAARRIAALPRKLPAEDVRRVGTAIDRCGIRTEYIANAAHEGEIYKATVAAIAKRASEVE